jgi:type I restriction enzyme S subunit
MTWREITLGDAIHVKHGFAFKGQHFSDSGEYVVLTPGNFNEEGGFRLRPGKDRFYTGDIPEDYVLDEGDLIVAMTEQGPGLLGSPALIPEARKYLHNQRLGLIQDIDGTILNKQFLYYLFNTRTVRAQISGSATGTKVKHTAPERIYRVKVTVPSEVTDQKRIGAVLSAYDDLIENNRRRIQLLEQAARLLYKEWFVHLRFPGHEHATITDGVPEGWEKKALTDLADSVSYGLTASSTQEEVGPKFLRITDIVPTILDWGEVPFCEATEKEIDRNRLEVGDVVVARTGATVGYAKLIPHLMSEAVYASYLVRFRFHTPTNSLIAGIFMESDSYKEHVKNHAGGAAQPNANAKVLGSAILLIPPQVLQEQFSVSVTPVLNQRDALVRQNTRLAQARDLLLPRLMNGEVTV